MFSSGRILVSIGTAYLVMNFSSIIVYAQAVFVFFMLMPGGSTVIFGMLWKLHNAGGGILGLLAGILVAFGLWLWVKLDLQCSPVCRLLSRC